MPCSQKERCPREGNRPVQSHTHHEYVVPRSIPITVPTSFLSASFFLSSAPTTSKLLAKAKAQIVQIAFIVKISPKPFLQTFSDFPFRGKLQNIHDKHSPRWLIFRSSPRVEVADWTIICLLAASDWSTHTSTHIISSFSIGRTRMSCHTLSSPAFSCKLLPVVM